MRQNGRYGSSYLKAGQNIYPVIVCVHLVIEKNLKCTEMKLKNKVMQVDLTSKAFPLLVHWLD